MFSLLCCASGEITSIAQQQYLLITTGVAKIKNYHSECRYEQWRTGALALTAVQECQKSNWTDCFELADSNCVLLSLLWHFFVSLTRQTKNVRHDCLLNPLICVLTHQPWPSRCNQFPASIRFILVVMGKAERVLFFLQTASPALPARQLFQPLRFRARRALRIEQYGVARRVHISRFPHCWIKSIGSDNAHPEQTLTCFSASAVTDKTTSCQEKGKGNSGGRKRRKTKFTKDSDWIQTCL